MASGALSVHRNNIPEEIHNPQAVRAIGLLAQEMGDLLCEHEVRTALVLDFTSSPTEPLGNNGNVLQMPPRYTPRFLVKRESRYTFNGDLLLPFSSKIKGVGAYSARFKLRPPPEDYSGWALRLTRLRRAFWMGSRPNQYQKITPKQHEATAAINGLADTIAEFRSNKPLLNGSYEWVSNIRPPQPKPARPI